MSVTLDARLHRWMQPSLMRRLLAAQMVVLAMLWTMAIGLLLYNSHENPELLENDPLYRAVLVAAEGLRGQPARQQEALRAFDDALMASAGDGNPESDTAPVMQVWQGGQLIYRTTASRPVLANAVPGRIEDVRTAHGTWRARTVASAQSDTRVLLAQPSTWLLTVTIVNRGYYILPLVVSLPFLIFPAWLSVRLALRPWRQVSKETAKRGPADLTPLSYLPAHKELRPLVDNINSLLQRVREGNARERSLIADAAHELRTPLAAMRVNVEALKAHSADPGQRELMDNLLRSNDRAARLVGQLLQLMRTDAGPAHGPPVRVPLDALVQDRLAMIDGLANARGIELELTCDGDVPVLAERESLVSMIDNLVDNAIKYGPAGSTVSVQVAREADRAVLRVSDRGPGIAPALRERVFDRFFRDPDQPQGGSGLGLAIVQSAVGRLGGTVVLDEPAGGGLRATVRLPLAPPGEAPPPLKSG